MRRTVLFVLGLLALAACGSGPGAGAVDVEGRWQLTGGTAGGTALAQPAGAGATMELTGEEVRGRSFCNHWFATAALDGSALSFDGIGGTEMGCDPEVMDAETAFLQALGQVREAARDGDDLVLTGEGVELRFSPVVPVPDSPLAGTRWVLDTLVDGDTASTTTGEPAVLVLGGDGAVEGSTGCRSVSGSWQLDGGTLAVAGLRSDEAPCPPDVERQDAHVTGVLGAGPVVDLRADRLTLTSTDGRGLGYRAR